MNLVMMRMEETKRIRTRIRQRNLMEEEEQFRRFSSTNISYCGAVYKYTALRKEMERRLAMERIQENRERRERRESAGGGGVLQAGIGCSSWLVGYLVEMC